MTELDLGENTSAPWPAPMNCPKCGRFARVTERRQDYEGYWWFTVNCKKCGPRRIW